MFRAKGGYKLAFASNRNVVQVGRGSKSTISCPPPISILTSAASIRRGGGGDKGHFS